MSKEIAIFAGGCFWCMVEPFETRPGILSVTSGYTGGHVDDPTYDEVSGKYTGHTEAVEIIFENTVISYDALLEIYWSLIDPTDGEGQFYDRGNNYRPAIYVENEEQRQAAEKSKLELSESGLWDKPIIVPIENAQTFCGQLKIITKIFKKNLKDINRCTKRVNSF